MSAPVNIDCPACMLVLQLPPQYVGQLVQCPGCAHRFVAEPPSPLALPVFPPFPAAPPSSFLPLFPPAPPPPPSNEEIYTAVVVDEEAPAPVAPVDDRPICCPDCGAIVELAQDECHRCGCEFDPGVEAELDRPWEREGLKRLDSLPHRGSIVLFSGIVSLVLTVLSMGTMCCPFVGVVMALIGIGVGIGAWWMGVHDLWRMRQGQIDDGGLGNTTAGMVCGIVGVSLHGILLLGGLAFWALMLFGR